MSRILYGAPVAEKLRGELRGRIAVLKERGITPTLALVRVGEDPGSLSYERSTLRVCDKLGIAVRQELLPAESGTVKLAETLRAVSADPAVHFLRGKPLVLWTEGDVLRHRLLKQLVLGILENQTDVLP